MSKKIVLTSGDRLGNTGKDASILRYSNRLVLTTSIPENRYKLIGAFIDHSVSGHQVIATLQNISTNYTIWGKFNIDIEKWVDFSSETVLKDNWGNPILAKAVHDLFIFSTDYKENSLYKFNFKTREVMGQVKVYVDRFLPITLDNLVFEGSYYKCIRYNFNLEKIADFYYSSGALIGQNSSYLYSIDKIEDSGQGWKVHYILLDYNTGRKISDIGYFIWNYKPPDPGGISGQHTLSNTRILAIEWNSGHRIANWWLLDINSATPIAKIATYISENSENPYWSGPQTYSHFGCSADLWDDLVVVYKRNQSTGFDAGWDVFDINGNFIKRVKIMDEYGYLINYN